MSWVTAVGTGVFEKRQAVLYASLPWSLKNTRVPISCKRPFLTKAHSTCELAYLNPLRRDDLQRLEQVSATVAPTVGCFHQLPASVAQGLA